MPSIGPESAAVVRESVGCALLLGICVLFEIRPISGNKNADLPQDAER
jgi:hypothetical protein